MERFLKVFSRLELFLELVQVASSFFCDNARKQDESDKVRECHEAVEDIGAGPYGTHGEVGADKDRRDVKPTEGENGALVVASDEVLQAFFGVVGPAENRREREEYERCRENVGGDRCAVRQKFETALESFHGDVDALEVEARVPGACNDDGEACHGADDDGVDEGTCHADETLADGFLGLCCGCCNRGGAETSLVTEDAAGDTFLHGDEDGAHNATRDGTRVESRADDCLDGRGNI